MFGRSDRADIDEPQLARLFEQARRYPLLKPAQEREIDARKWRAAEGARTALVGSPAGRAWIAAVARQRLQQPPQIEDFEQRELYFVLRRELGDDKALAPLRKVVDALSVEPAAGDGREFRAHCDALPWSPTLWTALAASLLRRYGGRAVCQVADALDVWAEHWQPPASLPPCEPGTHRELARALDEFTCARDTLTLHNLRLVYTIAGRHLGRGVPLADLVQEGSLGLMRAAEKYEARRGYRFSTYCYNWISQSVRRAVGETGAVIRYPAHVREQVNKLHAAREEFTYRHGRAPDDDTLAKVSGIALAKTRQLRQLRNFSASLDAPVSDEVERPLEDQLADTAAEDVSRGAELRSLHRCLLKEIGRLDETERHIVAARWGLHDGPALSRGEVADQLSVSREWVRQLEASALDKLRRNARLRELFHDHGDSRS
jgi:RNA polymerase sigma factor (sigma-70 family)